MRFDRTTATASILVDSGDWPTSERAFLVLYYTQDAEPHTRVVPLPDGVPITFGRAETASLRREAAPGALSRRGMKNTLIDPIAPPDTQSHTMAPSESDGHGPGETPVVDGGGATFPTTLDTATMADERPPTDEGPPEQIGRCQIERTIEQFEAVFGPEDSTVT